METQLMTAPAATDGARPDESEGLRLTPFARRSRIEGMPGAPEGRTFGYVSSGLKMPAEGSCYVVEFTDGSHVRVRGYVDKFGRSFQADEVLPMPPAYTPALSLMLYEDRADDAGCVVVHDADGSERRVGEFVQSGKRYVLENMLVRTGRSAADLSYEETMARLYLACHVFPEEGGKPLVPFGTGEVYEALAGDDLFSAIERIVSAADAVEANPLQVPSGPVSYLVRLLRAHGVDAIDPFSLPRRVPGREGDPAVPGVVDVRLARTRSYANAFYVGFDQDAVTPEGRGKLLCLESVLNRFWLVTSQLEREGRLAAATERDCEAIDRATIDEIAAQAPTVSPRALPRTADSSEWDARVRFCRTCERFRLPYRLSYRVRVNLDAAAMGIEATCPVSLHLPAVGYDLKSGSWVERADDERFADEARYAENVARLVLGAAFDADSSIEEVSLDIVRDIASRERVISGVVARADYAAAMAKERDSDASDAFVLGEFCVDCGLTLKPSAAGRLLEVPAARSLEDAILCPLERYRSPETDERPFVRHVGALHGVRRIEDLAITEGGDRAKLAEEVASAYRSQGSEGAVRALKDIHDRTEDLALRSVCTKVELAVRDDALGEDPARTIADLFADAWGLRTLRVQANALAESDPAAARDLFEQIVLLAQADGSFSDSPLQRWRYFDSYASRALFAFQDADRAEGTELGERDLRPVLPLPDEIFAAHHSIATLLHGSFEEHEIALEHAEECTRLAPSVAAGYLALARSYFLAGDYPSEIETIRRMLPCVWNPTDMGLALYWLAFALWRTGDPSTGAACYLLAMKHDPTLRDIAARELEELLKENPHLRYPGLDGCESTVAAAGFAVDAIEENAQRLVQAARAVADNGNLTLAASLLGAAMRSHRDDAFYPVFESLTAPID